MRIVQLINTLATADGGAARNAYELDQALNQTATMSSQLYWVKGSRDTSVMEEYPSPWSSPLSLFGQNSSVVSAVAAAAKDVRAADMTVIHGYYLPWAPVAAVLSRLLGTPVAVIPHGSLTRYQQGFSPLKKRVYDASLGWLLRSAASGFVTGSPSETIDVEHKFPRCKVVTGALGTEITSDANTQEAWNQPLRLLSLSRIAPKKRIDISIGAIAELRNLGYEAELTVAGTGDPELVTGLLDQAQAEGVSNAVHFCGEVTGEAKTRAFLEADLFLLPSDDENFGIGVAEAAAHGLPVIASDQVASARFLHGAAGSIVAAPTARTLAEAIVLFVRGNDSREAHQAARKLARQVYSWTGAAEVMARAFAELTGLGESTSAGGRGQLP